MKFYDHHDHRTILLPGTNDNTIQNKNIFKLLLHAHVESLASPMRGTPDRPGGIWGLIVKSTCLSSDKLIKVSFTPPI